MTALFQLRRGEGPLLVSIPHAGTFLPPEIAAGLTPAGRAMPDTDWHVDRLYAFLGQTDATVLVATHSRYVIDLNRGPDGAPLYPGQVETGLIPVQSFAGEALRQGPAPDAAEIAARRAAFWQPYHEALAAELTRLHARHGFARLLDAHSIRSELPRLFPGRLPALSFGTNDGRAAAPEIAGRAIAAAGDVFSWVLDGRFKGGWITRHYGAPAAGVHAIQLELAQASYLDERQPMAWNPERAAGLLPVLRRVVAALVHA